MHKLTIRHARFSGDLAAIAALIQEYIETIDRSACKEEVEAALDGLPAPYDREDSGYFFGRKRRIDCRWCCLFAPGYRRGGNGPAFRPPGISPPRYRPVFGRARHEGGTRTGLRAHGTAHPAGMARRSGALQRADFTPIAAYSGVAVGEAICYARELSGDA